MKSLDVDRIVLRMRAILLEGDRILDLARHGPDMHVDIEPPQRRHEGREEIGDRHRFERNGLDAAVAGFDDEPMRQKIENDIEAASLDKAWPAPRARVRSHAASRSTND